MDFSREKTQIPSGMTTNKAVEGSRTLMDAAAGERRDAGAADA